MTDSLWSMIHNLLLHTSTQTIKSEVMHMYCDINANDRADKIIYRSLQQELDNRRAMYYVEIYIIKIKKSVCLYWLQQASSIDVVYCVAYQLYSDGTDGSWVNIQNCDPFDPLTVLPMRLWSMASAKPDLTRECPVAELGPGAWNKGYRWTYGCLAHVNKTPTSCFRLNVFRLKKLNKWNFNDIGLVISKQKSC